MGQPVRRGGGGSRIRGIGSRAWLLGVLVALVAMAPVPSVAPIQVTFDPPTATSQLNISLDFTETFHSAATPRRVELLSHLPSETVTDVQLATSTRGRGDSWQATLSMPGHVTPNTTFVYRFRVVGDDGSSALGPEGSVTVTDDRFEWKTLQGSIVRLHWYSGSDAFAKHALDIGDKAIDEASALLGVTETQPVDFFIYDSEAPFRDALGPGTHENVGGQAIAAIRTLFGLIQPSEINSSWVDTLVTHELTHMVFNTAVQNPYHQPPRWLNEGLAVYLSQGYGDSDKAQVASAAANGDIMPLDAIAGLFPTTYDRFSLAYAESVSAVDDIIRTYGKPALVTLIRSYAMGVTDEEAFKAAIGKGVAAFADEWLAAQGGKAPEPFGPESPPPGPVPPDWEGALAASVGPGSSGGHGSSNAPGVSGVPGASPSPVGVGGGAPVATSSPSATRIFGVASGPDPSLVLLLAGAIVILAAVIAFAIVRARRARSRRPPFGGWPPA